MQLSADKEYGWCGKGFHKDCHCPIPGTTEFIQIQWHASMAFQSHCAVSQYLRISLCWGIVSLHILLGKYTVIVCVCNFLVTTFCEDLLKLSSWHNLKSTREHLNKGLSTLPWTVSMIMGYFLINLCWLGMAHCGWHHSLGRGPWTVLE